MREKDIRWFESDLGSRQTLASKYQNIPLRDWNLSKRTLGLIERNSDYEYVGEIIAADESIDNIPRIGPKTIAEIDEKVKALLHNPKSLQSSVQQDPYPKEIDEWPVELLDWPRQALPMVQGLSIGELLERHNGNLSAIHSIGPKNSQKIKSQLSSIVEIYEEHGNLKPWRRSWVTAYLPENFDPTLSTQEVIGQLPFIFQELVENILDEKIWAIISKRYGFWDGEEHTLESISHDVGGSTPEWIRQLEKRGLKLIQRVMLKGTYLRPEVFAAVTEFRRSKHISTADDLLREVSKLSLQNPERRQPLTLARFQEQQEKNERVGELGEKKVIEHEKQLLCEIGRTDLSERIEQVSHKNVMAGYDILSFDTNGNEKYIEVKATTDENDNFYITANEIQAAKRYGESYWLYRVSRINNNPPKIEKFQNPHSLIKNTKWQLEPVTFKVSFTSRDRKSDEEETN